MYKGGCGWVELAKRARPMVPPCPVQCHGKGIDGSVRLTCFSCACLPVFPFFVPALAVLGLNSFRFIYEDGPVCVCVCEQLHQQQETHIQGDVRRVCVLQLDRLALGPSTASTLGRFLGWSFRAFG